MTPRLLALIPIAVALNIATSLLVNALGLPVYLDTIGTVLGAALAGPWAAVVIGVVTQVSSALRMGYQWLPFALIQVLIALLAAAAAWRGDFRSMPGTVAWGVAAGAAAGAASAVISYFMFQGVTATGVTALTTLLTGAGLRLPRAVLVSSLATDLVDKVATFALAGAVLRALPRAMAGRYPWALRAVGR